MAGLPSPPSAAGGGAPRYYFAYGSNQHVAQMASRCPSSRFAGAATLRRHRWQINQRGVANVVPATAAAPSSSSPPEEEEHRPEEGEEDEEEEVVVEGLLYILADPADERTLDACEGVAAGCYEKRVLDVEVRRSRRGPPATAAPMGAVNLAAALQKKRPPQPKEDDEVPQPRQPEPPAADGHDNGKEKEEGGEGREPPPLAVPALVYLSAAYATDGPVRAEYATRMERAAADAVALGVPVAYVARHVLPVLRRGEGGSPQFGGQQQPPPQQQQQRGRYKPAPTATPPCCGNLCEQ